MSAAEVKASAVEFKASTGKVRVTAKKVKASAMAAEVCPHGSQIKESVRGGGTECLNLRNFIVNRTIL